MVKIGDTNYTTAKDIYEASGLTDAELAIIDLKVTLLGTLIEAREKSGLSQKELAQLCGAKQPYIARLERGATDPQLTSLLKILEPLGYTLAIVPKNKSGIKTRQGRTIHPKNRKFNIEPLSQK